MLFIMMAKFLLYKWNGARMNNEENNEENAFKSFYAEEVSKHQNTKH